MSNVSRHTTPRACPQHSQDAKASTSRSSTTTRRSIVGHRPKPTSRDSLVSQRPQCIRWCSRSKPEVTLREHRVKHGHCACWCHLSYCHTSNERSRHNLSCKRNALVRHLGRGGVACFRQPSARAVRPSAASARRIRLGRLSMQEQNALVPGSRCLACRRCDG